MKILIITLSLILSPLVYANGAISNIEIEEIWAGGYTDNGKPTVRIGLISPHPNPDGCLYTDRIVIYSSQAGIVSNQTIFFEQQYSAALMALANGNKLDAYLVGCTNDGKFALANRLTIKK